VKEYGSCEVSNPMDMVKKFAVNFAAGTATEMVRGYLNDQLKNTTPSDLYEAIITGHDLWTVIPDDVKATARKFRNAYRKIFDKFEDQITTQLILKWMKDDHLDLYSTIINTPDQKGIIWLDRQVKQIKQEIIYM
jgi:hypothetical protein